MQTGHLLHFLWASEGRGNVKKTNAHLLQTLIGSHLGSRYQMVIQIVRTHMNRAALFI